MRNNTLQVAVKLIASAAIALTTLCASAQGTDPATPTRREIVRAASPVVMLAIERLEARRGSPIGDDEIAKVVQTEDFRLEREKAVSEFCAAPENKNVMLCEKRGG